MDQLIIAKPFLFFLLATFFFYHAIQQPRFRLKRHILAGLHLLCIAISLQADPVVLFFYPVIAIPFVIGLTVHTASLLLVDQCTLDLRSLAPCQRLRAFTRTWTNIRRLRLGEHASSPGSVDGRSTGLLSFTLYRALQVLILWTASNGVEKHFPLALLRLGVRAQDFAPEKQGIVPPATSHDLLLRLLISVHWIWHNYCELSMWHNTLAIACVAVLRWDRPSEWPPLFGEVFEAYSLRRFWGIFWQRLHVAPFAACTPAFVSRVRALRALWIFLLSAVCHAVANWVLHRVNTVKEDVWFFGVNYAVCLVETAALAVVHHETGFTGLRVFGKWFIVSERAARLLGYLWVSVFFLCTVPGWQYPLVYQSLDHNLDHSLDM
ncbi:hypothetical protein F4820DRAFT_174674 [Hypoxylon rubiginosum]|uniref:Uncharacterized protein n=1 Tax=Hypoxylon rubiginosum TaxID=110542 RepID=A0ACB9YJH6_9PEZI|nr:hypothetical protein F4820DRAFT_174674 [Hypoxylon rubiginosum]